MTLLAILQAAVLNGGLIPGPNLTQRIEAAALIVVAGIRSGTVSMTGSMAVSNVVLRVDRVLKGEIGEGVEIGAKLEGRPAFITPVTVAPAPKLYGIWFLTRGGGAYSIVPLAAGHGELGMAVVALPETAQRGRLGRSPAEAVANELTAALQWMAGTTGRPFDKTAMGENLRSLPADTVRPVFQELVGHTDASVSAIGIDGLIGMNEPAGVKYAADRLGTLKRANELGQLAVSLIGYHNPDAEGVRALQAIAAVDIPELRRNVSYALRVVHTKEAMPALVSLLDSADNAARANALAGICLFVRNAVTVTPEAVRTMAWLNSREPAPFRTAETDRYCWMGGTPEQAAQMDDHFTFWKQWWLRNRDAVTGQQ